MDLEAIRKQTLEMHRAASQTHQYLMKYTEDMVNIPPTLKSVITWADQSRRQAGSLKKLILQAQGVGDEMTKYAHEKESPSFHPDLVCDAEEPSIDEVIDRR